MPTAVTATAAVGNCDQSIHERSIIETTCSVTQPLWDFPSVSHALSRDPSAAQSGALNYRDSFCFNKHCALPCKILAGAIRQVRTVTPCTVATCCRSEYEFTYCLIINQLDALISQIYFGRKLYMFWTVPQSIIRSFSLYTQQWYMSYRSAILILLASCQQTCKTCMTYTIAVCTMKNSR